MGRYEVCTTEGDRPEGYRYSDTEYLEALDAFGTAGTYSRARLARLYGGRRVTLVRGWRSDGDRFESITVLSPYPDASLTTLNSGRMIIRWIEERAGS